MTSIYIHIPFCKQLCFYCDFNKVFLEGQPVDEYIQCLLKEIALWQQRYPSEKIDTIYIGGGTPTVLSVNQLDKLLSGIKLAFPSFKNGEFTIETNPGDFKEEPEKLQVLKKYGVNRLSMGAQTFDNRLLKKIGRTHTSDDIYESIDKARQAGFSNISIDLIYALPKQSLKDFEDTLDQAIQLDLPHYSMYSLILENKTMFANWVRRGKLALASSDEEADMFLLAMEKMKNAGFEHYEVSNYAKSGFESQHNLVYWNNQHYYGFGAGASGYLDKLRYRNCGPIQQYLEPLRNGKLPILETEKLTTNNQMEEEMFLGLRKRQGVSISEFERKYGKSIYNVYPKAIATLTHQGLLVEQAGYLALSDHGLFLGNDVFEQFLID